MGRTVTVGRVAVGGDEPLALIAGPCVIESAELAIEVALRLKAVGESLGVGVIYKSSYDKANRTSIESFRGPGLAEGLEILRRVKEETGLPVLSDVHSLEEVEPAAQVLDCIQIPAFLCRQTDLVISAAATGKPVNIKKGQFLAPWDVEHVVEKIRSQGNEDILLTERGTAFGYSNLVADMRGLAIMRSLGYPVVFDVTHAVQLPGAQGGSSGGERRFIPHLARAAAAAGCDALFLEVHPNPEKALCDGPNQWPLEELSALLEPVLAIDRVVRGEG
ncbi:MAG: 3-deoxy-8-phosphooctulonate synthase [bacterium]|nr:3-deoxy-8-phosphooctulonate synthase [bacterium]MDV2479605.1 3-deoxy-8-phosphooctulonate synthase [bacterium]